MKTFKQLTVGDIVYHLTEGQMEYKKFNVTRVESQDFSYNYGEKWPRSDKTREAIKTSYHTSLKTYLFTNESDAIRYCKAQMMKSLFDLIKSAKKSIETIKDFRKQNFELLNHEWTEKQINILDRTW